VFEVPAHHSQEDKKLIGKVTLDIAQFAARLNGMEARQTF
jgi:hypothetical protein